MKRYIFLIVVLAGLFIFGLLIYNFSDEVDNTLSSNNWYIVENGNVNVLSFKDNNFSYKELDSDKSIDLYKNCKKYLYNSNINVIKLDCSIEDNKIYINNISDNSLDITMNNDNKVLYNSLDLAYITDFKNNNNLSDDEYNNLINVNFDDYKFVSVSDIIKSFKQNNYSYIAFVNTKVSYSNAYNYVELNKLLSDKNIKLLNTNFLTNSNKKRLSKISNKYFDSDSDFIKDEIIIYKIGKKSVNVYKVIDVNTINS